MDTRFEYKRMDRRTAVKWMFGATTSIHMLQRESFGWTPKPNDIGYGSDPNLQLGEVPWERTMTLEQLRTASHLSDIILPRTSETSPSASEVHVPDFIDEWISSPYETQQVDRTIILAGLEWIDQESRQRFGKDFHGLEIQQCTAICRDICYLPKTSSKYKDAARFFEKFRNLTLGGYYTTNIGMRDVGYVGNVALTAYEGPPPKVLKHLGIDKAPW